MSDRTGREPGLSGALFGLATGQEPMLGGERMIETIRQHVLRELHNPMLTHKRRADIGEWLMLNGDTRAGIGLDDDGLPDIAWVPISGGIVHIRDKSGLSEQMTVERFYMARYPVTWDQYRIFLRAGHADPRWWHRLRRRDEYPRTSPPSGNHPVQEVSWYDAIAYCRWLSARLGYRVRLPTEWEWQQAANGGDPQYYYPWGRRWEPQYANTRESRLRRAIAVGMYPHAESPTGLLGMCGNVLEWCRNEYAEIGAVGLDGTEKRVLRGGSWFLWKDYSHTFFRTGKDPYNRYDSVGFRLVADSTTPPPVVSAAHMHERGS